MKHIKNAIKTFVVVFLVSQGLGAFGSLGKGGKFMKALESLKGSAMASASISSALSFIGSIMSKGGRSITANFGSKFMNRDSIAPRQIVYGQCRVGGTIAHIDHIDSTGGGALRIHYHFNHRSDFRHGTFSGSEVLQGNTSGVFGTVDSDSQPKLVGGAIDRFSGDVLYIDNRSRIVRSTSQTEDIKIVLTI